MTDQEPGMSRAARSPLQHVRLPLNGIHLVILCLAASVTAGRAADQPPTDPATLLLKQANQAITEQKHDFAADRFREFLRLYPTNQLTNCANYGLAIAWIDGPGRNYQAALPPLQSVAAQSNFAQRPQALYYLGLAQRGVGEAALNQAASKPASEADPLRRTATQLFSEATASFTSAANLMQSTTNQDWPALARCDATDGLLKLAQWEPAAKAAQSFLQDPTTRQSPYRELATYHLGYAHFQLKEYLLAGRALSGLAPFQQDFGMQARYLLGRIHHLAGERVEATLQYRAALADYELRKKTAQQALQNPAALSPEKRATCESLVRDPTPDYLARALFHLALALAEDERFSEAADTFATFIQQNPKSPWVRNAQLRQAFCRMQTGNFADAAAALPTLTNHPPSADRALWWLARCQIKLADPKNPQIYETTLKSALDHLRRAADLAGRLPDTEPELKIRHSRILMELADTLLGSHQFKEAAETYKQVVLANASPASVEEAAQRHVTALHLGGSYRESDDQARLFEQAHPKSTLLPLVLLRKAEDAYLSAVTLTTNPAPPTAATQQEGARLLNEAVKRYQYILTSFPDFSGINRAREGLGSAYYRLNNYPDALAALSDIPPELYTDNLAHVPYLLADCLIRCAPRNSSDAVSAADLLSKAQQAAKLLDSFIAANDKNPKLPDALFKLGWCHSRIAEILTNPEERKTALTAGRTAYDRLIQAYAQDPAIPMAIVERAACLAALNDPRGAINELTRFSQDPLRNSPVAPTALIRLADLMRTQNLGANAAITLQQYRAQFEATLLADPARTEAVPQLQLEQALSLRQAGKTEDARALFENIVQTFTNNPVAPLAAWRLAQYRRDELTNRINTLRLATSQPNATPEQLATALRNLADATNTLASTLTNLLASAATLATHTPGSPAQQVALYQAAWSSRILADIQTDAAAAQMRQEAVARIRARLACQIPTNQIPTTIREPTFPGSDVPQPILERTALDCYQRLATAAPNTPLAAQAQLDQAGLLTRRSQHDAAARLLAASLDQTPPPELVPHIRLLLATACLAPPNASTIQIQSALAQAERLAADPTSPLAPFARGLIGEARGRQTDWPKCIEQLIPFRDQDPLRNLPDLADRALVRLALAFLETAQWDLCRSALTTLTQRFPRSIWFDEALYYIAYSWQKQEQYDKAAEAYLQLINKTASPWGARAQIQLGLCRFAQSRKLEAAQTLQAMTLTYDYPDWQAAAYYEAARIFDEMQQPDEANRLLQKVVSDYSKSPWAQTARERLDTMRKAR